eukprot:CAMPEP_0179115696 /NCGR_PEP_ID=MMETSP0796-20121207/54230_1 /TAXON_ID=73915 /ORGANISM="Pyrodinium bahamense, Strain pbaha01" /LENGTH=85 /DNA_ID=CAMNT_0020813949 /DNA_START=139 /DNA_END=395 /DNA_ORIENTATION=+
MKMAETGRGKKDSGRKKPRKKDKQFGRSMDEEVAFQHARTKLPGSVMKRSLVGTNRVGVDAQGGGSAMQSRLDNFEEHYGNELTR